MNADYPYDRPIVIVAAPRSGSTMLFEILCHAKDLWTIGDESHMVFENINKLNPNYGICTSNRLTAEDADDATVDRIRRIFSEKLCDRYGQRHCDVSAESQEKPRILEKTPKNSLRTPFLNTVFPDAHYIYLFRDPRENMSSMIEAWRSSNFVTYPRLPDWPGAWSLLLPPKYQQMRGKSLEEIVAFQWHAANQIILNDLGEMPYDRWTAVSYAELLADTPAAVERLCRFADIEFDTGLKSYCENTLPLSRYTQTTPKPEKWRMNETMVNRVIPGLQPVIAAMDGAVAPYTSAPVLVSGPISTQLAKKPDAMSAAVRNNGAQKKRQGRNERCDCGSGLRYKHCHGDLRHAGQDTVGTET